MKTTRTKKASGLIEKSASDSLLTKSKEVSGPRESSYSEREIQTEALVVYTDRSISGNNSFPKIS